LYAINDRADLPRQTGVIAKKIILKPDRTLFTLIAPEGQIAIDIPLSGKFNVYNTLAATCVGLGENIPLEKIKESLEDLKNIAGRMQRLDFGQDFDVIVDFAHTPDGLKNVFEAVKPSVANKLIHVGGATGNRDKTKRPLLGALAGKYADIVIVTNEDPYSEDPESIINQVALGVPRGGKEGKDKVLDKNFFKISNRKSAILKALQMAKRGDLVLITGKGCETKMAVGENKFIPWSDVEIVKEYLNNK
jgi:UDP-N-acetylmuramoyl-L-alanyl-D-glutamate--2,6-diaminopimelate ligase